MNENTYFNPLGKPLHEVSEFLHTEAGDKEIWNFVETIVEAVNTKEKYAKLLQEAEKDLDSNGKLDPKVFAHIAKVYWEHVLNGPPAHGLGHCISDMLLAALISQDNFDDVAKSRADIWAGVLGGILHDTANSVTERYTDRARRCGHGEIAGWELYYFLEPVLSKEMRILAAYATIAHTHYTSDIEIKLSTGEMFTRKEYPYWDIDGTSNENVGVAILITRLLDRLSTRGIFHFVRHGAAEGDVVQKGLSGAENLGGPEHLYTITSESLRAALTPILDFIYVGEKRYMTVLKTMSLYSGGDLGDGVYGRNDIYLGSTARELLLGRNAQLEDLKKLLLEKEISLDNFNRNHAMGRVRQMYYRFIPSKTLAESWAAIYNAMSDMSDLEIAKWQLAADYALKEYDAWVKYALANVEDGNPVIPMIEEMMPFIV